MGRPRLCECGECQRCRKRESAQRWRDNNPDKVRRFPSEAPGAKSERRARKQAELRADPEAHAAARASAAERQRKYRQANRSQVQEAARMRYQERKEDPEFRAKQNRASRDSRRRNVKVQRVLAERRKPCVDCGVTLPPEVMDLDHVRGEKSFTLASGVVARSDVSMGDVEAEIAKCEVRCPTCHRIRHWNEYCLGREAA